MIITRRFVALAAGLFLSISLAQAANILIVTGASTTFEPSTTTSVVDNVAPTCGPSNTYTSSDTLPANINTYDQIWDVRFSNSSALTAADNSAYTTFLQSGKTLFLMGENVGFMTRNNSVLAFIDQMGGGSLSFIEPGNAQTVHSPFTDGPLTAINYLAPGGVITPGTGSFATSNATGGSAIAWTTGTMSNAPAGAMTVVFDVNFMMGSAAADQHQFFVNLCSFMATATSGSSTAVAVPTTSITGLGLLGSLCGLLGVVGLRRRQRP
ncbi:IPTL-CTERM sorting domain-containing protein [Ottowia sp.]|uniref:IPTL-CTERM sorting domain-containing protein n=1 Tax=Ottowia sp. TaxID=1898956 RepID=UPI003A83B682